MGPKKRDRPEREAEVVPDGGEDGVCGITGPMCEVMAAHTVFGLDVSDDGLDGGAPRQLTFDSLGDGAILIPSGKARKLTWATLRPSR